MKVKTLAVVLVFLALVGCATVDVTKTAKGAYNATNPNDVEVLMTRPTRPFVELGTVTVTGYDKRDVAEMHNAIRAKVAPLGANAAILTSQGIQGSKMWAMGVAIRWTDTTQK
jgi:hypothetical protein